MKLVEQKDFATYQEGEKYMNDLAAKLREEGFKGKFHLKADNLGSSPVTFTLKQSESKDKTSTRRIVRSAGRGADGT